MNPAVRTKGDLILLALPFAMMAAVGAVRVVFGSDWGLLPLLVVGPAVAAAVGGLYYTLIAGAVAMAECVLLACDMYPDDRRRPRSPSYAAVGVTAVGAIACLARERRASELAQVRLVAEVAQQVLLRPVPDQVGAVTWRCVTCRRPLGPAWAGTCTRSW